MLNRVNVLVAEGRKLTRQGLCALLHRRPDLRVVGEADDVGSACRLFDPLDVQVVVLIGGPPAQQGVEAVRRVRSGHPAVGVVVVVPVALSWDVRALVDAGASGCLTLAGTSDELVAAVRAAAAGRRHVSPALASVTTPGVRPTLPPVASLAPREVEVLRRIASGQSTKEIAADLRVGPKTIETHRRRIMKKLDRHSVAELTHMAILNGLVALQVRP